MLKEYCTQNVKIALIYSTSCLLKHNQYSKQLRTGMVSTLFRFLQNSFTACVHNIGLLTQALHVNQVMNKIFWGVIFQTVKTRLLATSVSVQKSNFIKSFEGEKVMIIQCSLLCYYYFMTKVNIRGEMIQTFSGNKVYEGQMQKTRKDINCQSDVCSRAKIIYRRTQHTLFYICQRDFTEK